MADGPSSDLDRLIDSGTGDDTGDALDRLRQTASRLRDLDLMIANTKQLLETLTEERTQLTTETLPAMMDEARVPAIELAAIGNVPAVRFEVKPFVNAGISAKWDPAKKAAAFAYLDKIGAGDLIKTVITVRLPRERRQEAVRLAMSLQHGGYETEVAQSVHPQTLSAWLRERVSRREETKLDLIGGIIGRVVAVKEK